MPGSRELISDKLLNPTQDTGFGPKSSPFHVHLDWVKRAFKEHGPCEDLGGLKMEEVTNDPSVKLSKRVRP